MVLLELDFFMVSFVLVDVLLARSNTVFLLRSLCSARRTAGSSNSIRLSGISISFGSENGRVTFALQMNQAAPGSACHGFSAADDIHLGKDRFYVRFHRAFADE